MIGIRLARIAVQPMASTSSFLKTGALNAHRMLSTSSMAASEQNPFSSPAASSSSSRPQERQNDPKTKSEHQDRLWSNVLSALRNNGPDAKYPSHRARPNGFSSFLNADARVNMSEEEHMESAWANRRSLSKELEPFKPNDGRMVEIARAKNVSFPLAFFRMQAIIRRNNLRAELALGERYEKPNQRRRRLKSQRHRRRFAHLVREKVQLIMHLTARGA